MLWQCIIIIIICKKVYKSSTHRITYCEIFTIGNADGLVMKKIGNRLITEADTDCWNFLDWFFQLSDESEPSWLEPGLKLNNFQLNSARLVTFSIQLGNFPIKARKLA